MEADDLDLLEEVLREDGIENAAPARMRRRGATEAPASLQQRRLWFLHRLDPDSAAYTMATALRLSGTLQVPALERAIALVIRRHEILRTVFRERDGEAFQVVTAPPAVALAGEDWRDRRTDAQQLAALVRSESQRKFDLEQGPLVRFRLVRLADEPDGRPVHVWLISMHHIIADGWSLGILFDEIFAGYRAFAAGRAPELEELPVQYADYAAWQRERLDDAAVQAQLAYWRRQLDGIPVLDLATDDPRPPAQTFAGDLVEFSVPAEVTARLRGMRRDGTTLFMILTAAFGVLLARRTRQDDCAIGTSIAQRGERETHGLIGFLVNMLVLRFPVAGGEAFAALLDRVRRVVLEAFDHADLPYEALVERLRPARDPGRNPLFQVALTLLNAPRPRFGDAGLTVETIGRQSAARFDLELLFQEGSGGRLDGLLAFNTDLFRRGTAEQIARELCALLADIARDPERPVAQLQLVTGERRRALIAAAAGPRVAPRPAAATLPALLETQVARSPDAIALVYADTAVTYRELERRANRLARCLIEDGIGPECVVAVLLDRSPELIVALLASLKAGAAYLPLDPEYPPSRLAFMLRDSGARRLLTTISRHAALADAQGSPGALLDTAFCLDDPAMKGRLATRSDAAVRDEERNAPLGPANLAYLIYTSGSTGTPKGAGITHAGLINYLDWANQAYLPASANGTPFNLSVSFDASVTQIYLPLLTGSTLHLLARHDELDGLAALVRSGGPFSFIKTTPALFDLLRSALTPAEIARAASVMILGGEQLGAPSCAAWRAHAPDARLFNEYGPTETVVGCAIYEAGPDDRDIVPIGQPIWNTALYLLDTSFEPVGACGVGELFIAGAGVARGYLGRPDLTADRFVPCPFGAPGARMYRTGDLARYRADGVLMFLGRLDDQVKLRGFRIELGEVEATLLAHEAVEQAVVTVRRDADEQRLVAHVVPRTERDARTLLPDLRAHAAASLPAHMVPAAIVLMDALPLTANGKVDRKALPTPGACSVPERRFVPPRTPLETILCSLFASVLRLERVGLDDDFFALGGHSLLATRLISRIEAALGARVPVRALFDAPNVAALATHLSGVAGALDDRGASRAPTLDAVAIPHAPRDQPLVLAPAQTRLWFLDLLDPGSSRYNIVFGLRLRAAADGNAGLDESALRAALDEIVRRHEILRTAFRTVNGRALQVIEPPRPFALQYVDLRGTGAATQDARVADLVSGAMRHRFDLSAGPLALGWLVRLSEHEHRLLIAMHHIIVDGWSFAVFTRELHALYAACRAGQPSPLAELPIQYADFARWQHARLEGAGLAREREYWLRQLADLEPVDLLPLDRPRTSKPGGRGALVRFVLDPLLARALTDTAARHGATLFMALVTALAAVLHRSSGATDLPIGTPVAGRGHAALEDLVGFFVNTLVLRLDARHDPDMTQFLAGVRETALAAYAHQEMPFEELVERLAPPRDRGRHPLFGIMVVLQNASGDALSLPGLSIEPEPIDMAFARFDLTLLAEPTPHGLACVLEYDTDLLDQHTVERLAARFRRACQTLTQEPETRLSELRLETAVELARRREVQRGAALALAPTTVVDAIFDLARQQGDAIAACWTDGALSYGELARRVRRIAAGLQARGVSPGDRVGAAFERSGDMVVALLGIMAAGAAYVPLDPHYPAARLAYTIADSGARLILAAAPDTVRAATDETPQCRVLTLDAIEAGASAALLAPPRDRLAYVIYTSGSTGAPKGVMVSQANLWASTAARRPVYGSEQPRFALLSSFAFDSSVAGIFGTLCAGGTLVLPPPGAERDPVRLLPLLQGERVTQSLMLPALYLILLDLAAGNELDCLQTVIVAGEDCGARLLERHFRALPHARLANEYGPTEASVWCTVRLWTPEAHGAAQESEVTIGAPIPGVHVWLRGPAGEPVPLGTTGELCIGGPGVSLGYFARPGRTAESFVPDPESDLPGARCYRSGDGAQFTPSGGLRLLGRIDRQIKVRGFRVEPGEVEAQILQSPWVREVTVTTTRDARDRLALVGHVVAAPGWDISEAGLRAWLAERMPAHMVPGTFVWHDSIPRAAGGKVDHAALDTSARRAGGDAAAAPRDTIELQLVRIWEDVLGAEGIGIEDDFFTLGGHSLLAVELIAEVRRRLGRDIPLATLFSAGTVARLADAVRSAPAEGASTTAQSLVPLSRREGRPLFLVHQAGGNVMSYLQLARSLGNAMPLFGLQARGLDGRQRPLATIEAMAAHYIAAIRQTQPAGPYRIAGHSLGGRIAQEMARQLEMAGEPVEALVVIDVPGSELDLATAGPFDDAEALAHLAGQIGAFHGHALGVPVDDLRAVAPPERLALVVAQLRRNGLLPDAASAAEIECLFEVYKANMRAVAGFMPQPCRADIHVLATPALCAAHANDPALGWGTLTSGAVRVFPVEGEHMTLLAGAHVGELARLILQACGGAAA